MKLRTAVLTIVLGCAFATAASANSLIVGYAPRTGDVWMDAQLGDMNVYGHNNRDFFIDDVVVTFGAPRYLVNDLLLTRRWAPGDVYYACALAYQLRRPCGDVVHMYDQDHGQGWGVIAQRMGIKPGSAQFHALKGEVGKANGKFKAHGPMHDGDAGGPGNSDKADKGNRDGNGNGNGNSKGNKAKGNGNGKGSAH